MNEGGSVGLLEEVAFEDAVLAHIERSLTWSIYTCFQGRKRGVGVQMPGFWPQHRAAITGRFCDPGWVTSGKWFALSVPPHLCVHLCTFYVCIAHWIQLPKDLVLLKERVHYLARSRCSINIR